MIDDCFMTIDLTIKNHSFCNPYEIQPFVDSFKALVIAARDVVKEVIGDDKELNIFLMGKFENKYTAAPSGSPSPARDNHLNLYICMNDYPLPMMKIQRGVQ